MPRLFWFSSKNITIFCVIFYVIDAYILKVLYWNLDATIILIFFQKYYNFLCNLLCNWRLYFESNVLFVSLTSFQVL